MDKNKKKRIFSQLNIRMTVYYSVLIAVFAICLTITISCILLNKWKEEMGRVVEQKVDFLNAQLSQNIEQAEEVHFNMLEDEVLQKYMRKAKQQGISQSERESLRDYLKKIKQKNAEIMSILPVNEDGEVIDSRSDNSLYYSLTKSLEMKKFQTEKKLRYLSVPNTFPLEIKNPTMQEKETITYYGRYYDRENYSPLGYLVVNWKKNSFLSEIDGLCNNTFEESCIIDKNNNFIYEQNKNKEEFWKKCNLAANKDKEKITIDKKQYLIYCQKINAYPNWNFIGLISCSEINRNLRQIYFIIFGIVLLMFLCVVIISFKISQGITKPVKKLTKAMKILGTGKKPEPLDTDTQDEMQTLIWGFNKMVQDMDYLQQQIVKEQEERKNYEIAIVKTRLDLLQNQINPHFIHNTLNTLKYMAQKEENYQLAETITAFNMLLRTSMSTDRDFTTVSIEIENLENYMKIQRQRYEAKVKIDFIILDNTDHALIPKLILQPLVENSLFHGVIPKGKGNILVAASRQEKYLKISVSDDGVGIPEEKQKDILKLKKNSKRGYNNIGLANVNERLLLYYGEESRMDIISSKEFGTFITFIIPYQE